MIFVDMMDYESDSKNDENEYFLDEIFFTIIIDSRYLI